MKWADHTIALAQEGYTFILNRRLEAGSDAVDIRLLGQRVICIGGPQAVRLFYDENRFERKRALPRLVRKTLVGQGGVQTLDDPAHLSRKALFLKALGGNSVSALIDVIAAGWATASSQWAQDGSVVLFDEAARVLTRGVCEWAGAPLPAAGAGALARNLIAMVDSFGTVGPRNWRGRLARGRTEMWARRVVRDARRGLLPAAEGSVAQTVAEHRDLDGKLLSEATAAVELLNIIRPTVAVAWFVTFAAHALHEHPQLRERVRTGDEPMVRAFTDEVRRFYPFAPFLGARVRHDFLWNGHHFRRGTLVLLDIYGTDHDPDVWERPDVFDPDRFLLDRPPDQSAFVPQGGGGPRRGHRCAGESLTVELIKQAVVVLARLDYGVPEQDLTIPLGRIPTRPRSGLVISNPAPYPASTERARVWHRPGRSAPPRLTVYADDL